MLSARQINYSRSDVCLIFFSEKLTRSHFCPFYALIWLSAIKKSGRSTLSVFYAFQQENFKLSLCECTRDIFNRGSPQQRTFIYSILCCERKNFLFLLPFPFYPPPAFKKFFLVCYVDFLIAQRLLKAFFYGGWKKKIGKFLLVIYVPM